MRPQPPVFVDAVYLIAAFDAQDQWRAAADLLSDIATSRRLVTTDGVLSEFLAHCSRYDGESRGQAAAYAGAYRASRRVEVIELTTDLMEAGIKAYGGEFRYTRLSLQDCISILVMRRHGITEALTADREFTVAGISVLMQAPARES